MYSYKNSIMINMKEKCPVPLHQQPYNEYKTLKQSCFFSWPTSNLINFVYKLLKTWLMSGIVVIPLLINVLLESSTFEKILVLDLILSSFVLIILLIRLHLGWSYIIQRLLSATIIYEESGWYDGEMWIKPSSILAQDRLIAIYEVRPLLNIINKTLLISTVLFIIEIIIYSYIR